MDEFLNEILSDVDNKPYVYIPVIIILTLVIIWIINVIRFLVYRIKRNIKATPFLLRGMIPGNQTYTIEQNPKYSSSIPILRSRNENEGIEFSYTVWLFTNEECGNQFLLREILELIQQRKKMGLINYVIL